MTVPLLSRRCPGWAREGDGAGQADPVARVGLSMAAARPPPFPPLSLAFSPQQQNSAGEAVFLPSLEQPALLTTPQRLRTLGI